MSQFTGQQHKGAMRERRADKKREAETRNAATLPQHRRAARRDPAATALLAEIFTGSEASR